MALDLLIDKYEDKESHSGELIAQFNSLKICRTFPHVREFQNRARGTLPTAREPGENLNSSLICSLLEAN